MAQAKDKDPAVTAGAGALDAGIATAKAKLSQLGESVQAPPGHVPVTLTIRPGETRYVPPDEVPVLRHQGLLVEDAPDQKGT